MKRVIFFLSMLFIAQCAMAQFDGAVGTQGCKAISLNNPNIKAWASGVQVKRGYTDTSYTTHVSYGKPYMAQGRTDSTTTRAISLGYSGEALVTFDCPIQNGQGADFAVFENAFGPTFLELAFVEVSSNGVDFFRFPAVSNATSVSDMQATKINNLAGKYEVGYGVPFNLDDIADNALLDKMNIRFVKLIDVNGVSDTDVNGNVIYDAVAGATGYSAGFDLTGVAVLNGGSTYLVADFSGLLSSANTYEQTTTTNGVNDSLGTYRHDFVSNGVSFGGLALYNGAMWCGFAVSNMASVPSNISELQYLSASMTAQEGIDSVYGVSYYSDYAGTVEHNIIKMNDNAMFSPLGTYINNAYSTYNYMKSAAFPANGYLQMIAYGYDSLGVVKDSAFLSLADANHSDTVTGMISQWTWFDMSHFGSCSKVKIILNSNDKSEWGMNIPSYFCIDRFTIATKQSNYIASNVLFDSTQVTTTSANLYASLTQGTDTITLTGFSYKLSSANTWNAVASATFDSTFSYSLVGLQENTTYNAKAWIVLNGTDTLYSDAVSFKTLQSGGLNEVVNTQFAIQMYPNPAKESITIIVEGFNGKAQVSIFDMQGRCVNDFMANDNGNKIDVSVLKAGAYYVRVKTNTESMTKKLIVE